MNKNLTEMIFIMDRSGSMQNLVSDTIGGYNNPPKWGINLFAKGDGFAI